MEGVQYGDGLAEVIRITIGTNERDRKIIVTYVPPRTNMWKLEEYKTMQKVLKCLDDMIRKDRKVLLVGDFNCKGVNWKGMEESGNAGSWSEEMLQLVIENTLDQWVEEFTRLRGEDEPSMLDLVFTKKPEPGL